MPDHNFLMHMNGDDKQSLYNGFQHALDAAEAAEALLRKAAPNMRNYYPLENGEDLFKADHKAFVDQLMKLVEVKEWATEGLVRVIVQVAEVKS